MHTPSLLATCKSLGPRTDVVLADFVLLRLVAAIQGGPVGLRLEQAHGVDVLKPVRQMEKGSNKEVGYPLQTEGGPLNNSHSPRQP